MKGSNLYKSVSKKAGLKDMSLLTDLHNFSIQPILYVNATQSYQSLVLYNEKLFATLTLWHEMLTVWPISGQCDFRNSWMYSKDQHLSAYAYIKGSLLHIISVD